MRLLLNKIDNAPLDRILAYYRVVRRDKQPETDWTLYFSPWHKGENKILRVSNGHKRGGLYASPFWEVADSTANKQGYGAISLVSMLLHIEENRCNMKKIVCAIADICEMRLAWLEDECDNGITERVDPQDRISVSVSDDFSVESLPYIGCMVERVYKETSTGRRIPVAKDGKPVFRFSFGEKFSFHASKEENFNPERLHDEMGLYEVSSYTTKSFWHDGLQVSLRRKPHPLFPVFAVKRTSADDDGKMRSWGEIYQPEWHGAEGKGCERSRFLWMESGLDAGNIPSPLLGDGVCQLMMSGMNAEDAIQKVNTGEKLVTTKQVEQDIDGKKEMIDVEIAPEDVKVTNIILCSDALNAACAYFHLNAISRSHPYRNDVKELFFHVVWPYKKDVEGYTLGKVSSIGSNRYIVYPSDSFGKRASFKICKRNNRIRKVSLPERMSEYFSVFRGGVFKKASDVCSFFTCYEMTEEERMSYDLDKSLMFLSYFTSALPIEPLVYRPSFDKKTGALKSSEYRVDSACLWEFMATEGYCREVIRNSVNQIGRYVHVDGCFVRELDGKSIVSATQECLKEYARRNANPDREDDYRKMANAIITSRDIIESKACNLPVIELDYKSGYGPKLDYFFYRNGALRITPDDISFVPYGELGFYIDRSEVMDFDFKMPCAKGDEPFRIYENPEYGRRVRLLKEHRADTKSYTQVQINQEERDLFIWAQTHRWLFDFKGKEVKDWWQPLQVLRCFANEEYEQEAELQREGKSFSEAQEETLRARLANILYSLGRPLFRYKGGGTAAMPYITESRNSYNDRAEGGSGKSIFVNVFMGCSGHVYRVDSRNIQPNTDITLMLDGFIPHCHRVIHWEDWPNGLKIDPLYNYITSGFNFRQRHKDTIRVMLDESPGHAVTSNFQQTYEDPSSSGRTVPTGFSHRFNRGDTRKNRPPQKVSDVMPGLRENPEDMDIELRSQIAYINAMAVQFCMVARDRVLPPMEDLNERSQKKAMGDTFVLWAKEFFSHDYAFLCPIDLKTLFTEYVDLCESSEDKRNKFSQATFRNKVVEYCADNGYVCNPDVCYSSETDKARRYMRVRAWCKRTYFADESVWGPDRKKEIRELIHSQHCLFFVRTEEEAKRLTREQVKNLLDDYYGRPDPAPILNPENGEPYMLTDEERSDWDIYMLKKQGNYMRANKLSNERDGAEAGALSAEMSTRAKTGEAKADDELPF